MSKTEYLYGINVDSQIWATMPYKETLELKCKLAYDRMTVLNKEHYLDKDSLNINECYAAIRFNEKLLEELK